jgi:hypothetical protein
MKLVSVACMALSLAGLARAEELFPGLKSVLTEAEWKRAGLDRLTPDEVGVIDAALIRHEAATVAATRANAASTSEQKHGLMERFGLPTFNDEWRNLPVLKAKVVKWETTNRFLLDNGQVWEGAEPIPYELTGKAVEIQPRPSQKFALAIEGEATTVRVRRVR